MSLWLAAAAPLALVLVLLIGLRWKASSAASAGFFLAAALALTMFQTPLSNVALQSVKGVWDALFIAYVIAPALLLYQVSDEAGAFGAIRRGIEAITPNDLLHVLAFAWAFPSFLQGITGFGAPIAVAAPLLLAIGVRPLWAVALPIIGHAWAKTYGTLGVAWAALMRVTEVENPVLATVTTGVMLGVASLLAGFTIAWLYGRSAGVREALPAVLIISAIHGFGQIAISLVAPNLANVIPGTAGLLAVLLLARRRYAGRSAVENSPVMAPEESAPARHGEDQGEGIEERQMSLWLAFGPYLLLITLIMLVEMVPFIGGPLGALRFGLPFPELVTGFGVVTEASSGYSAFAPLTQPGTFLIVSSLIAFWFFRSRGHIGAGRFDDILVGTIKTSAPTVMAIVAFLPLALVLEGSGMVLQLAGGIATVASGPVYAFVSPFIGAFGGFLTGSNLSSNILFGPLQEGAARALGIDPAFIVAAQTAGASVGASIAISSVLMGLGVVGGGGEAGSVIRKIVPYAAVTLLAMALIALAGALIFPGGGGG